LRFSPWNLLLLLPFLMLVTPWFNAADPRLFGMPFFYWVQFAWVAVGVVAVGLVYFRTRDEVNPAASGEGFDVDELDEGGRR
jgi:membrane protease YdiL (CAAX protease family)